MTASRVSLTPWTILRKSPWWREASARVASLPSTAAVLRVWASLMRAFRLARTCSMVSLMKTFLPGNVSRGASKLPRPNSPRQAMAFFLTAMWPKTMTLTPSAMALYAPWYFSAAILTSMSPRSCWVDMKFISSMTPLRFSTEALRAGLISSRGSLTVMSTFRSPAASFFMVPTTWVWSSSVKPSMARASSPISSSRSMRRRVPRWPLAMSFIMATPWVRGPVMARDMTTAMTTPRPTPRRIKMTEKVVAELARLTLPS